jgi:hypothetical protein
VALALSNPYPSLAQSTPEDEDFVDEEWEEDGSEPEDVEDASLPLISHPDEFYQLDDNPLNPIGDNLDPLMSRYLTYETVLVNGQPQNRGFFDRLLAAFSNPLNAINEALGLIGIPLIRGGTQTNARAQQTAIAISDLQVKVAQIEQEKRKIAETLRE